MMPFTFNQVGILGLSEQLFRNTSPITIIAMQNGTNMAKTTAAQALEIEQFAFNFMKLGSS
jgi:hypothetical protein